MTKTTSGRVARSTSTPCVTHKTIKQLFAYFQLTYQAKWAAQCPEVMVKPMIDQWQRILSKFTPADIKRGTDTWTEDWPPNIFEFEKVCRPPPTGCFGILAEEQRKLENKKQEQRISKEQAKKNTDHLLDIIRDAKIMAEDGS